MLSFNDVLVQIFQPYFLYSTVFLTLAFLFVKLFLKLNPLIPRIARSLIWLLPLCVPIVTLLLFPPQTTITFSVTPEISAPSGTALILLLPNIVSYTGLLCIIGVSVASIYSVLMIAFGKKVALKRFNVVMMAKNEYGSLQHKVQETAHKIGIPEPKVGLIDDLMPNAFTVGYGKNTVLVFSLGLLKMLNAEEMSAVIAHELSHIKAKDYLFKTLTYTLNIVSFFNPFAYIATAQAQKERELLADERGADLLGKPLLMARVFAKLEVLTPKFPKAHLLDRLSANLFLVSPLAHRPAILASHPQMSHRIQNIKSSKCKPVKSHRKILSTTFLIGVLISLTLIIGYSTVEVQKTYLQNENTNWINQCKIVMYNASLPYTPGSGTQFSDIESYQAFISGQYSFVETSGKTVITRWMNDIQGFEQKELFV